LRATVRYDFTVLTDGFTVARKIEMTVLSAQGVEGARLCVVGARGGSQGVPGKNIRNLRGKPVIAWTIERALASGLFDAVVVSTDSDDIAAAALQAGALVPFRRPADLATSSAGKFQVWQHALSASEEALGRTFGTFVDIDCTNPLLEISDYVGAVSLFDANRTAVDAVMTVGPARRNPYFNLVEPDASGALRMSKSRGPTVLARQAAPPVYEHVAGVYVLKPDYLRTSNHLLEGVVIGYEVSAEKTFDIDNELDFQIIEFLLERRLRADGGD